MIISQMMVSSNYLFMHVKKQEEASKAISLGLPYQTYLEWWHKTAVIGHHQQPKLLLTDHLYSFSNMHFPAFKTMQG